MTENHCPHPATVRLGRSRFLSFFLYYVMPFIDGETLRDKLGRETQLGIDEAVKISVDSTIGPGYDHPTLAS